MIKKPTLEEEVKIYRRFLIRLHTARWTFHEDIVKELLDKVAAYSYARTNSNGDWKQEEEREILTLIDLDK